MRMTKEHFAAIKKAMDETMKRYPKMKQEYKKQSLSKIRYAWDIFNASFRSDYICKFLYPYLNDSHIQTALLKIVGEY